MLKKFNLFMTFLIIVIVVTACSNTGNLSDDVQVDFKNNGERLSTEGFQTYSVQLADGDGNPLDREKVYIYMNMKMMNHPIEGTMKNVAPGIYELDLPLAMAGDWYVHISVTENGETVVYDDFTVIAEGEKNMEYMKGYHADEQ